MTFTATANALAQSAKFPPTRFMGSKAKLLQHIALACERIEFETVGDLFCGSGVVAYLFKCMGKQVLANDHMAMSAAIATAMIENSSQTLSNREVDGLFEASPNACDFVQRTFRGLYFSDEDNAAIDLVRANIKRIADPHKRAVALAALIRACVKKRARGIFTYTGHRYDDGRRDLQLSIEDHVRKATALINGAIFDNGKRNQARWGDALTLEDGPDLVYLDPPYYSPLSDNEYVRRYHFVEGLARDWQGVDLQWHTKTRKFRSYPTPFRTREGALDAFDRLFGRLRRSAIILSYSSNSLPTRDELATLMSRHKRHVDVIEVAHRYSFANQGATAGRVRNEVKEYLFIGR